MLQRGAVDAYESVGPAIRALDKAKGAWPLKAIRRDLFVNPLRRDEANRYDAIVFDPPRAGAQEQVQSAGFRQDAAARRRLLQSRHLRPRRPHPRRWRLPARQRPGRRSIHLVASRRAGRRLHQATAMKAVRHDRIERRPAHADGASF